MSKPFKETKVGKWLAEKKPDILNTVIDTVGTIYPPVKLLKGLFKTSGATPEEIVEFDALMLDYEKEITARMLSEDTNVTERWKADSMSDSWMSKNSRPITLLSLLAFLYVIILSDSISAIPFQVSTNYIDLLQILLTTVVVAYFGGRSYEKGQSIKKK